MQWDRAGFHWFGGDQGTLVREAFAQNSSMSLQHHEGMRDHAASNISTHSLRTVCLPVSPLRHLLRPKCKVRPAPPPTAALAVALVAPVAAAPAAALAAAPGEAPRHGGLLSDATAKQSCRLLIDLNYILIVIYLII